MFKVKSSVQLATRKEVKISLRIIINDLLNLKYIISILTKFEKKIVQDLTISSLF